VVTLQRHIRRLRAAERRHSRLGEVGAGDRHAGAACRRAGTWTDTGEAPKISRRCSAYRLPSAPNKAGVVCDGECPSRTSKVRPDFGSPSTGTVDIPARSLEDFRTPERARACLSRVVS
jgi:hypothetical protein